MNAFPEGFSGMSLVIGLLVSCVVICKKKKLIVKKDFIIFESLRVTKIWLVT